MYRTLVAGAAATVAATMLTFAPAEAATYVVTLKTPAAKIDVAKTFTLAGSVAGSGKGSKTLKIQRKIGSGAWSTYTTVKTRSTGTFSKTLTMSSVGAKNFRVVAPAAGSTRQGISATRVVTGYTWISLYDQRYLSSGGILTRGYYGQLNGRTPPAHTFTMAGGDTRIYWNLGSLCDSVRASLEVPGNSGPRSENFTVNRAGDLDPFTLHEGESRSLDWDATGGYGFSVDHTNGATDGNYIALLTPRAHCSTTSLPLATD